MSQISRQTRRVLLAESVDEGMLRQDPPKVIHATENDGNELCRLQNLEKWNPD